MSKQPPPLSRSEFLQNAQPVQVVIGGNTFGAGPREFSTGSFGWYLSAKTNLIVDGKSLPVQIGLNLTVVGSKETARS